MSRLLDELLRIRDGDRIPFLGLCDHVHIGVTEDVTPLLQSIFRKWPKFSGSPGYPVPSPDGGRASIYFRQCDDMYTGKYGELRLELLDFIIKELS